LRTLRSPLPPAAQLANERHHRPPLPPLSRPEGLPSTPIRVATGCCPSHWLVTPGATVLHHHLPHGAHRRPLSPIDLQPSQEYHELPLRPLLLTDPKFRSGSLSSASPTTASPPLSSSPSVGRLGKLVYIKTISIESLGARLAPRHHLARPLVAGWSDSVNGAAPVKGGNRSPVSSHEPGRFLSRIG
jgi:hypothetical protein